ncbi:DNA polymerase I [Oscillatoria acuminata]|uniref:DNA polymerase I n=1 Tax=Oscillatoria acuminata PCC 6304 TaxID=56110 RepID=K9TRE8_9CYAN|nr:DNA polymerase I [Oscillatoria acuminata]AFY85135.1 DNA polymerase I [Oscillatoria acuminata PCC 6304]
MSATSPTFILVDGHSLAFRSYYALAKSRDGGLSTSTGIPTSVSFGFLKSLIEVMAVQDPQYLAVAFDLGLPTFRHEADDTYKSDRAETPEDFITDLKYLQELLTALNLQIVTAPGYEADDVLGTLATRASEAGFQVKILTGDRDLFQLVDAEKQISVLYLGRDAFGRSGRAKSQEFGPEQVQEKMGIPPELVVDYKALCGDTSDNIPGVKGIGDKTAIKLLTSYGSLDQIYEAIADIKGANRKKLEEGKDEAYHSQHLARIVVDVPLELELDQCQLRGFDETAVIPRLEALEFKSFLPKIKQLQQRFGGLSLAETQEVNQTETQTVQTTLSSQNDDTSFWTAEETEAAQELAPSPINPTIIDTPDKLEELVKRLKTYTDSAHPVAWDTETTDLEPRDSELVGIGCCWGSGEEDLAYIPIGHKTGQILPLNQVIEALRPVLESSDYPKAFHNVKFDRLVLRCQGIQLAGVVFDTLLASYLINPETTHNLTDVSTRYLEVTAESYKNLGLTKGQTIADLAIPKAAQYCGLDVFTTYQLVGKLQAELADKSQLHQLLLEVEQPLEPVLAEMEYTGIRINSDYLGNFSQQLEAQLQEIETKAYQEAGEEFNLGSPKQLSYILFEKLDLPISKSRKTKTGYSTDAAVLERLQGEHPLVDLIIENRTLAKLKSTYVDALPKMVHQDTHRVHTNFNQAATATGRLSSSNPNLQNIPIKTEFSRQIRSAFLPEQGWLLVSADYSQIELRILAHLSQEPVLIEAYQNNRDVHTVTAQLLFEKETVTAEERRMGKTINFGVIYGMGSVRFARAIGKTSQEGKLFIKRFYERYGKVFECLNGLQKQAIAQGYVETILGRRRYFDFQGESLNQLKGTDPEAIDLDKLNKKMGMQDSQNLRAAANAPIQGSSADIIKVAMVKMHEVLKDYQARLLLQVHDELVFEVPPDEWEELQPKIKSTMEMAVPLSVPLMVDIHAGDNWMEAK